MIVGPQGTNYAQRCTGGVVPAVRPLLLRD
jgi:hypothetical protein